LLFEEELVESGLAADYVGEMPAQSLLQA